MGKADGRKSADRKMQSGCAGPWRGSGFASPRLQNAVESLALKKSPSTFEDLYGTRNKAYFIERREIKF